MAGPSQFNNFQQEDEMYPAFWSEFPLSPSLPLNQNTGHNHVGAQYNQGLANPFNSSPYSPSTPQYIDSSFLHNTPTQQQQPPQQQWLQQPQQQQYLPQQNRGQHYAQPWNFQQQDFPQQIFPPQQKLPQLPEVPAAAAAAAAAAIPYSPDEQSQAQAPLAGLGAEVAAIVAAPEADAQQAAVVEAVVGRARVQKRAQKQVQKRAKGSLAIQACQQCRKDKAKCTGSSDESCARCARRGHHCTRNGSDGRTTEDNRGGLRALIDTRSRGVKDRLEILCYLQSGSVGGSAGFNLRLHLEVIGLQPTLKMLRHQYTEEYLPRLSLPAFFGDADAAADPARGYLKLSEIRAATRAFEEAAAAYVQRLDDARSEVTSAAISTAETDRVVVEALGPENARNICRPAECEQPPQAVVQEEEEVAPRPVPTPAPLAEGVQDPEWDETVLALMRGLEPLEEAGGGDILGDHVQNGLEEELHWAWEH